MFKYKINIDKKVISILGPHLYGDTASIVAELISNCYDADADNCWVTIKTGEFPEIIIEDDGEGMTPLRVNRYFLNIGYDRRDKRPKTKKGRRVFGRKGIGKLAAFSLAKRIELYSTRNGKKAGCILDYDEITKNNKEPVAIPDKKIRFAPDRLSASGTGTKLVLKEIQKNINTTYYYLVNRIIRNFSVDFDEFKIHLQKNDEEPRIVKYADLDFFKDMDTIVTIGSDYKNKVNLVKNNSINKKYKMAFRYEELLKTKEGRKTRFVKLPKTIKVFSKSGRKKKTEFFCKGWIGTITTKEKLRGLVIKKNASKNEKESISINDNRITLFSRKRIGEYDVLPKIQTDTIYDAYIIGEIHVDLFEDDKLVDMAISNRRGYEETDERYKTLLEVLKPIVSYIAQRKAEVQRIKKQVEDRKEAEVIKKGFLAKAKTREILEKNLTKIQLDIVQDDHLQFSRATLLAEKTKQVFISHNSEHKQYGLFIIKMFEKLGVKIEDTFIFTSYGPTGVPFGEEIYEYLKSCFRKDLYVIFLFSKYFYDSNICIAETGAAWATNRNHCNVVIDIKYKDIDKPISNTIQGLKIGKLKNLDRTAVSSFIKKVLNEIGHKIPPDKKILDSIDKTIKEFRGKLKVNSFYPTRKYQGHPICPQKGCKSPMDIVRDGADLYFECPNPSCKNRKKVEIY